MSTWLAAASRAGRAHLSQLRQGCRTAAVKASSSASSASAETNRPPAVTGLPTVSKAAGLNVGSVTQRISGRVNKGILTQQAKGKRAQKKLRKEDEQRHDGTLDFSRRVSALLMGSVHRPSELAAKLRERFGPGAVRQLSTHEDSPVVHGDALLLLPAADTQAHGIVADVLYLCVPAAEAREPSSDGLPTPSSSRHSSSTVRVFFFTGSGSSRGEALDEGASWSSTLGSAAALGGTLGSSSSGFAQFERLCVSVWWGASPAFEEGLLRDLRASAVRQLPRRQVLDRLSVEKEETSFQMGSKSKLADGGHDEIVLSGSASPGARLLDQLAFSHALQRHMRLQLVEDEAERLVSAMKRTVRQGLGAPVIRRLLPSRFGGVESSAVMMQRLLLLREFNYEPDIMSTPDWLWDHDHSEREALYDAMVEEYEIEARIDAVNQQLDYAQTTLHSLKEDMNHRHSMFIEMTIVLLISFEVIVEMHALGWISLPGHPLPSSTAGDGAASFATGIEEPSSPGISLKKRHTHHS